MVIVMLPKLFKILIFLCALIPVTCAEARDLTTTPFYQVDLIIFMHQHSPLTLTRAARLAFLRSQLIKTKNTTFLKPPINDEASSLPYTLLPNSFSTLKTIASKLQQNPQYKLLADYSWLQPNSRQAIILSPQLANGWQITGSLKISGNHFYFLRTELFFFLPGSHEPCIMLNYQQRLLENKIFYIDHPQIGMIIKIKTP